MEDLISGQMSNNMQTDCGGWCSYNPDSNCWDDGD